MYPKLCFEDLVDRIYRMGSQKEVSNWVCEEAEKFDMEQRDMGRQMDDIDEALQSCRL